MKTTLTPMLDVKKFEKLFDFGDNALFFIDNFPLFKSRIFYFY